MMNVSAASCFRVIVGTVRRTSDAVQPTDASVMKHADKSFLTLITCDTYDEKTGTYLHRVVIGAALVDVRPLR